MSHRIVIAGLGNIGSQVVRMLQPAMADEVVLVDPDAYAGENLATQAVPAHGRERNKARAQAQWLRQKFPGLAVTAHPCRLQEAPLGVFRNAMVLSGLDSRAARVALNERVCRAGALVWIDGGVLADGRHARVSILSPGPDRPCYICGWAEEDFSTLEQTAPCQLESSVPGTGAPAWLGGLAASLMLGELEKAAAAGDAAREHSLEFVLAHSGRISQATTLKRDVCCRFDHRGVHTGCPLREQSPQQLWAACLAHPGAIVAVEGVPWMKQQACARCGSQRREMGLAGRVRRRCCGRLMLPQAPAYASSIPGDVLHRQTPRGVGLRRGDMVTLSIPSQAPETFLLS